MVTKIEIIYIRFFTVLVFFFCSVNFSPKTIRTKFDPFKEIMALYSLKKYRFMKRRYGDHGSYEIEVQRILEAAEIAND